MATPKTAKKDTVKAIVKIFHDAKNAYDRFSNESWERKIKSLQPYEQAPPKGRFYDEESRKKYADALKDCKVRALDAVALYAGSLDYDLAAAPSEEALRAVEAFKLIDPKTVSIEDYTRRLNALNKAYGDNVTISSVLTTLGKEKGIHLERHPSTIAYEDVDGMERTVSSFFNNHTVFAGSDGAGREISAAEISFFGWFEGLEEE